MSPDDCRTRQKVNRVAIIGAGPSGIAAAKYLLAERTFSNVTIFEQRSEIGGLWIHSVCPKSSLEQLAVPQTNAHQGAEAPLSTDGHKATFLSPVYDRLETNIPRGLMGFSDLDWPSGCQLFPKHEAVLDYIQAYASNVKHIIKFNTQVSDVRLLSSEEWLLTTTSTLKADSSSKEEHHFDAVIVANGHFRVEYIPPIEGLEDWHEQYPDTVFHSKLYRRAEDFANKKVLIVGNSASGVDIGAQIKQVCQKPLIQSSRSQSYLLVEPPPDQTERPEIARLVPKTRTAVFVDGSEETGIEAIVFCTGYMYNLPFLESLQPELISTGERVQHLYKHIFYYPQPTLSFLMLNQKAIPFPTAEAQAAVVARFLAGRMALPSRSVMEQWEQGQLEATPRLRDYHMLKFPKDADYINELHRWACEADLATAKPLTVNGQRKEDGILGGQKGKVPPLWSGLEYWTRERFPDIKRAFLAFGEARHSKTSLEQVGFDYDAWKAEEDRNKQIA